MTTDHHPRPAIDSLVEAMLTSCGQLAAVLAHMELHRSTSPDVPPPAEVLADLLTEILEPLLERHGEAEVATTAQVLAAATQLIGEELFLVNLDDDT